MQTFSLKAPRYRTARVCRRNPPVRMSNWIEVAAVGIAVTVTAIAIAFACAIGAAAYDARSRAHPGKAQALHEVAATVLRDRAPGAGSLNGATVITARWYDEYGVERVNTINTFDWERDVNTGDSTEIWTDGYRDFADPPATSSPAPCMSFSSLWSLAVRCR